MNDKFTGMNPEQVQREVREFQDAVREVSLKFSMAGGQFFEALEKSWFSNNAVEFSSRYSEQLYVNTVDALSNLSDQIVYNTMAAYADFASANGLPCGPIDAYIGPKPSTLGTFGSLRDRSDDGSVGMNAVAVREALSIFRSRIENAYSLLDSLPTNISFFDANDSMKSAYSISINMMKNNIRDIVDRITRDVEYALENEATNVSTSVGQAVDALGGGTTSSGFGSSGAGFGGSGGYGSRTSSSDTIGSSYSTPASIPEPVGTPRSITSDGPVSDGGGTPAGGDYIDPINYSF